MKRKGLWIVTMGTTAAALMLAPARAQDTAAFFRVVSPATTAITSFSPDDGILVWSNASAGVHGYVQRATTLTGSSNWTDFAEYTATGNVMTVPTAVYLVIDLSAGPTASNYPVSTLSAVPAGGWTDEYKTTKLALRRIPAGTFTMGSPTNEIGRLRDETQHPVTLTQAFYMGVFEVTQKQWERVMGIWPSWFNNATYRDSRPVEQVSYYEIREDRHRNDAISPNWPQSGVAGTNSFMGKLRAKTGLATLDLPTESQWEYACRAGTTTALNSGGNLTNATRAANLSQVGRYYYNGPDSVGGEQSVDTSGGTATVGSYLANAWGLYDMHGNVWEWCLDWYGTNAADAVSDPPGATAGSDRVVRSGSWKATSMNERSAMRFSHWPNYRYNQSIGFRVASTL